MTRKQKVWVVVGSGVAVILSALGGSVAAHSLWGTPLSGIFSHIHVQNGISLGTLEHGADYQIVVYDGNTSVQKGTDALSVSNGNATNKKAVVAARHDGTAGLYSWVNGPTYSERSSVLANVDGSASMTAAYSDAQVTVTTSGDIVMTLGN